MSAKPGQTRGRVDSPPLARAGAGVMAACVGGHKEEAAMATAYYPEYDYSSLSVRDLLDARHAYHAQLAHLDNVIATAIGRYRIRIGDPYANSPVKRRRRRYGTSEPRTLANTVVRPWSWPCVLVFVKQWYKTAELARRPDQAIPRALYLPDGRVAPTCVIFAPPDQAAVPSIDQLHFPTGLVGGGFPCYRRSQGVEKVGTIGCLVSRAGDYYALTNRHVAGETGHDVLSRMRGTRDRIGTTDTSALTRLAFEKAYPTWAGTRAFVTMDAGLIRVEDLHDWTSQVFGIGEMGAIYDLCDETISLDLIGLPVRAFGAASGPLEGEIQALFYRHRTVGGFDYVADLLIGPRRDNGSHRKPGSFGPQLFSRPGDSGAIWFVDPPTAADEERGRVERGARARKLRPVAVQWGGQRTAAQGKIPPYDYALATFLSTICRELDVEPVTAWNTGYSEYWGKLGHFKIGYAACDLLTTPSLKDLMTANRANIGFPDSDLLEGSEFRVGRGQFVPLADVPDYVWSQPRPNEGSQHFADLDEVPPDNGPSLMDLWAANPGTLRAADWKAFYAQFDPDVYAPQPGCLPFRIRQIYDEMVRYAASGATAEFVAAAGILAHYVADATQPLHLSALHHGDAPRVPKESPEWKDYKKSWPYKIHAIYDEEIFERYAVDLLGEINTLLGGRTVRPCAPPAADYPVRSIFNLVSSLSPTARQIVDADDPTLKVPQRAGILFDQFSGDIARSIADACALLAELWETAWHAGNGDATIGGPAAEPIGEEVLKGLVHTSDFLPSVDLDGYIALDY